MMYSFFSSHLPFTSKTCIAIGNRAIFSKVCNDYYVIQARGVQQGQPDSCIRARMAALALASAAYRPPPPYLPLSLSLPSSANLLCKSCHDSRDTFQEKSRMSFTYKQILLPCMIKGLENLFPAGFSFFCLHFLHKKWSSH